MVEGILQFCRVNLRKAALRLFATLFGVAIATMAAGSAQATEGIDLNDGKTVGLEDVPTGTKLVLEDENGTFSFAGCAVSAADLTAIAGYSAQLAYLVVIEGEASCGNSTAKTGRMLIFPPYGGKVETVRFDAARLVDGWSEVARNAAPDAFIRLQSVASGQKLGVSLGRLSPTSFNVAVSGSASSERTWRPQLGGPTVRELRFAQGEDEAVLQQMVVASLLDALGRGDATAVAGLLGPPPFGPRGLAAGKNEARPAVGPALGGGRGRGGLGGAIASPPPKDGGGGGPPGREGEIYLRTTRDFVFVQSIMDRN